MDIKITDMYINKDAEENLENGGRIATATIMIDELFLIHGVNLMQGKNGMFCAMPSIQNEKGEYQNFAYFTDSQDRDQLTMLVMKECFDRMGRTVPDTKHIRVDMHIDEKGSQKAYATVIIDGKMNINRIRIMEGKNGLFVSMPKVKDSKGEYRDVISPASKEAYAAITGLVMKEFFKQSRQADKERQSPVPIPDQRGAR